MMCPNFRIAVNIWRIINTIASIWLKNMPGYLSSDIWFLREMESVVYFKNKKKWWNVLRAVRSTLITFWTVISKVKKQHSLSLWGHLFLSVNWTRVLFFSFSRRTFSHSLDSAPEFQIVPYRPWPAGPSLNGTCVTSRHFSNKAFLNKPNTTLGSPLGSYRGVAEPWLLYRMFTAVKRIKLTSFPLCLGVCKSFRSSKQQNEPINMLITFT